MSVEVLEVERKYDVGPDAHVPALAGVVPGATEGDPQTFELVATYYDTPDLALRNGRTTLRRRTGGADAGWHLKMPAALGRLEVQLPAGKGDTVPAELRALVRALSRREPLAPVAELRTTRVLHPVLDAEGALLVEVADDRVTAKLLQDPAPPLRWREWEAELGSGQDSDLDAVAERLLDAGAEVSTSASKVGRVLARHPAAEQQLWWRRPAPLPNRPSAGLVLHLHLAEQVAELVARDPQVRRDQADAVHKMRVATRRLRSALKTFRPLLDRAQTDPLRDELRWLAAELGAARDAEVMRDRLLALLDDEPALLVLGPVRQTVTDVLGRRYRQAHLRAVAALDSDRYLDLLDSLDALVGQPSLQPRAGKPADTVLPPLVGRAHRALGTALANADAASGTERDELLHEARKQAKQVRYACEAVRPVVGKPARRLADRVTALQEILGEHQDSVVLREALLELGAMSGRAGRNGFTFGRLHGLEQARSEGSGAGWRRAARRTRTGKVTDWLP